MLGQAGMADRMQARAEMEPRRVAIWKLEHECGAVSDVIDRPMSYVMSIARARYKVQDLADLGEKQIWVLLFDLRRNAQRRRARLPHSDVRGGQAHLPHSDVRGRQEGKAA
jgi:hypothetical protein